MDCQVLPQALLRGARQFDMTLQDVYHVLSTMTASKELDMQVKARNRNRRKGIPARRHIVSVSTRKLRHHAKCVRHFRDHTGRAADWR